MSAPLPWSIEYDAWLNTNAPGVGGADEEELDDEELEAVELEELDDMELEDEELDAEELDETELVSPFAS